MVFSHLLGRDVSNYSEEHRHECECRALLRMKPTRSQKHMHLYGVADRSDLFQHNSVSGRNELKPDYKKLWPKNSIGRTINPLMHWRGIEEADRILADAKRLYDLTQQAK